MEVAAVEASAAAPTLVMSVENCTEIYGNVTQCLYSGYQTTITCFTAVSSEAWAKLRAELMILA